MKLSLIPDKEVREGAPTVFNIFQMITGGCLRLLGIFSEHLAKKVRIVYIVYITFYYSFRKKNKKMHL